MTNVYSDYLTKATNRLMELLSLKEIPLEEKKKYIISFSDNLANNSCNSDLLIPCDELFTTVSLKCIDAKLADFDKKQPLNKGQMDSVETLCKRQIHNISFLKEKNLELPHLVITDIENWLARTRLYSENKGLYDEAKRLDKLLSDKCANMKLLTEEDYSRVFVWLDELEKKVADCKQRGIDCHKLKYCDVDIFRQKLIKYKKDSDNAAFFSTVKNIDDKISAIIENLNKLSYDPTVEISPLLSELNNKLLECEQRGINTDSIKNKNSEYIERLLIEHNERLINDTCLLKTQRVDTKISKIVGDLSKSDDESLAKALLLLDELDKCISECNSRGVSLESIRNVNTTLTRTQIQNYKKELTERRNLYNQIIQYDSDIENYGRIWESNPDLLKKLVTLCQNCSIMVDTCNKRGWSLPQFKCGSLEECSKKYSLYWEMIKLDRMISVLTRESSRRKLQMLRSHCRQQKLNIRACSANSWPVPELMYNNPDDALKEQGLLTVRKRRITKILLIAVPSVLCLLLFVGMYYSFLSSYKKTHSRMPIAYSSAIGDDYLDVVEKLEDAGFKDVQVVEVDNDIVKGGTVVSVTVKGKENFAKDKYYSKTTDIVVYYACKDRINISSIVEYWDDETPEFLQKQLIECGLVVEMDEIYSTSSENNGRIKTLEINETDYQSGSCYVPKDSKVIISYYGHACKLQDSAENLEGQNYQEVRAILVNLGFDNISYVRTDDLITGIITEDGSVKKVTINGDSSFEIGDTYFHDSEVVIVVNTFKNKEYKYIGD